MRANGAGSGIESPPRPVRNARQNETTTPSGNILQLAAAIPHHNTSAPLTDKAEPQDKKIWNKIKAALGRLLICMLAE